MRRGGMAIVYGAEQVSLIRRLTIKILPRRPPFRERAKAVRLVETLQFVVPYLDDSRLSNRAVRTVIELAHLRGLCEPHAAEFEPALKKALSLTDDPKFTERADRYLRNE